MKNVLLCLTICLILLYSGCEKNTALEFENTVAAVAISPASGLITPETQIQMSVSTPFAEIRYSLDGQLPTQNSPLYEAPFSLIGAGRHLVKARAFRSNWNPSPVSQVEYNISHQQPEMVFLPAGSYYNGITNVSVQAFSIDKTEVTQAEYWTVMGSLPLPNYRNAYPVYYVSWFQALVYCNKRSLLDGLSPCYSYGEYGSNPANWPANYGTENDQCLLVRCDWQASGYRLPTEIEWLYAYLGGPNTHYYTYSGSELWEEVAWCNKNSGYTVHPVATKAPNELGLYDLSGNLWEWCWDLRQDNKNPTSYSRSVRGGSWYSAPEACNRYSSFSFLPIYELSASIGFRCCKRGSART